LERHLKPTNQWAEDWNGQPQHLMVEASNVAELAALGFVAIDFSPQEKMIRRSN